MQISSVRVHELLNLIASRADGVTAEELRQLAYPRSRDTRGARRVLSEFVARALLTVNGARYHLTPEAWRLRSDGGEAGGAELDHDPDDSEAEDDVPELHKRALRTGRVPAPPRGPWMPTPHGLVWCRGRDGVWWCSRGGGHEPRAKNGNYIFRFDGYAVWAERLDVVPSHPLQIVQPPMQPVLHQWQTAADGRPWLFDGYRYWTVGGRGELLPVPE